MVFNWKRQYGCLLSEYHVKHGDDTRDCASDFNALSPPARYRQQLHVRFTPSTSLNNFTRLVGSQASGSRFLS